MVVLTLGLTVSAVLFAGVLVVTGHADVPTGLWAAGVLIGAGTGAALSFFALAGRRRRIFGRWLATQLLDADPEANSAR
ncbi:hypothetical protein [Nocardia sp. NPDC050435]|uniref:hypothetical protein n=1 Tax=Nocardia sp. NPDC050435 TaxID=3155040 RepID=UPI0033C1B7A8